MREFEVITAQGDKVSISLDDFEMIEQSSRRPYASNTGLIFVNAIEMCGADRWSLPDRLLQKAAKKLQKGLNSGHCKPVKISSIKTRESHKTPGLYILDICVVVAPGKALLTANQFLEESCRDAVIKLFSS